MDEFVIIGDWIDDDYAALQQESTRRTLSREEMKRLVAGPRRHPYGEGAYQETELAIQELLEVQMPPLEPVAA